MDPCDVLIVGAGPAGSSCAWKLKRAGCDVAILDKQVFPRDKVCGGWITPDVLARLEIDPSEYGRDHVLQPITGFRTSSIGGRDLETRYGKPVSYGIRRREFDDYLLKRTGARILPAQSLASLERSGGGWMVNGAIRARIVIGAGGHFCPVARRMGAKTANESAVVAQETEFVMSAQQRESCRVRADTPELYFCRDLKGYGWCFRKGDVLNVGLGRADPHRLSAHVARLLQWLRSRLPFEIPAPRGHAYLLHGSSPRRIAGGGWLLIGDAAGLAYPLSGEGILPAIESGLLAADVIACGQSLEGYPKLLDQPPGWTTRIGRMIPSRAIGALAPHLLASRWFARSLVLDRWFLHTKSE